MKLRSPSSLWLQAGLISLLILIGVAIAGYPGNTPARYKESENLNTQKTPKDAIIKAQDYLIDNAKLTDPHQLLILDYLYRAYGIKDDFSAQSHPIDLTSNDKETQTELQALQRIAYPDRIIQTIDPNASLVVMAANCDHIQLPHDYSQFLTRDFQQGKYEMTHAALSLQIAKELGCHVIADDELRPKLREGLIDLVNDKQSPQDLRYEAIALLGYLGFTKDIQPSWVDQIVSEQQEAGNWVSGNGNKEDHATVLALWALLESSSFNKLNQPLVRPLP